MTKGSGDARMQPLFFLITTAGTDRHSVCIEQHQKTEDVLLGRKIDPTFYPVIYGGPDDADWSSEKVWHQANPSLGYTYIDSLGKKFHIKEIACDRWGAVQIVQNLEGLGFTVVPFGQGFKDMLPPSKELMKLTLEQKLAHGGHPVLRWMMDNIFVRTDPVRNIKPDKEKSTEKIDGAVAAVMALDREIRNGGS